MSSHRRGFRKRRLGCTFRPVTGEKCSNWRCVVPSGDRRRTDLSGKDDGGGNPAAC